jgi:hypothetical protein
MDRKKALQQIISLPAWEVVEEIIKEQIVEGKKPLNIKTEGKTAEMIALEVMAKKESAEIIMKALREIKRIGSTQEFKKDSYR